jgi:elongation factor G
LTQVNSSNIIVLSFKYISFKETSSGSLKRGRERLKMEPKLIRNIALVSHSQAGKTSLAEAMLFEAGATNRLGKIEDGSSAGDYNPDEIERKITIDAKSLFFSWQGHKIQLLDTPGYADFVGEVICSLKAVDSACVLIDATGGIEVGTERVWGLLEKLELPRLIFVNKLDKENTDFFKTLNDIQENFGKRCLPLQIPLGKESAFKGTVYLLEETGFSGLSPQETEQAKELKKALLEVAAETDDALLEAYLEGKQLTLQEIKSGLRKAVLSGKFIPVCLGSATLDIAAKELNGVIVDFMPSPLDRKGLKARRLRTSEEILINAEQDAPFSALVFKTISDPYVGQLSVFRVFSGTLKSNTGFYNSSKEFKERIGQLYLLFGKEQRPVDSVSCGDIAAVAKLKSTSTGDSLCDEKNPVIFEPIEYPKAAISVSVKPRSRADEEKILGAISKLSTEDPTFSSYRDSQTKELIISGLGDLHLEVKVGRMKQRYNVQVDMGTPKVAYKETVTKISRVQGKYKRQSGGRGQYGDVWLQIEPLPKGQDFEFVDKIVGGAIPRNYIPAVEKGVREACQEGVLAGYPLVDLRVTLYDGSYHSVDSSDLAFQIAGAMALRKGALEAAPVLLEPIMNVEVIIPEEYMGQISGDLNSRRGRIMGVEVKSRCQVIKAQVPLAEMFRYATDLRSLTGGRGSYSMEFSHYEEVPHKIASVIISQAKQRKEGEGK